MKKNLHHSAVNLKNTLRSQVIMTERRRNLLSQKILIRLVTDVNELKNYSCCTEDLDKK